MRTPAFVAFVKRVGGLALIYMLTAYLAGKYVPEKQAILVNSITGAVLVALIVFSLVKRIGKKK